MFKKLLLILSRHTQSKHKLKLLYGTMEIIVESEPTKMIRIDDWPIGKFWYEKEYGWVIALGIHTILVWPDQRRSYGLDLESNQRDTEVCFLSQTTLQDSVLEYMHINGYTIQAPQHKSIRLIAV